jgi:hypothetical protein
MITMELVVVDVVQVGDGGAKACTWYVAATEHRHKVQFELEQQSQVNECSKLAHIFIILLELAERCP